MAAVNQHQQVDWQQAWDQRKAALERLLGPAEDDVFKSDLPIRFGGMADVLLFEQYVEGHTYVTAGLTATSDQPVTELGQYELMMCSRDDTHTSAAMLSMLSQLTLSEVIEPGEIIPVEKSDDPGVTLEALIAIEPDLGEDVANVFVLDDRICGLLLLVGVTAAEAQALQGEDWERVHQLLIEQVVPYTEPRRASVV